MPRIQANEAIELFRSNAERHGLSLHLESPMICTSESVHRVLYGGSDFRLVFNQTEKIISLLISHGPLSGPEVFWLDIFEAACDGESFLDDGPLETSFVSSLAYGFELMMPGSKKAAPN